MSRFELQFQGYPDSGSPVQHARVPWDSEMFGLEFYEIRLPEKPDADVAGTLRGLLAHIRGQGAIAAYCRIGPERIELAQVLAANRFYNIETTFEISRPLNDFQRVWPAMNTRFRLKRIQVGELEQVAAMAGSSFRLDRFHLDPNLSDDAAGRRYEHWVREGYKNGDVIYVYFKCGDLSPIGFYQIREVSVQEVDLSLAAMTPAMQQAGIGPLMYQAMIEECVRLGYSTASTRVSLNNLNVVNLFIKLGFTLRRAQATYHWFAGGTAVSTRATRP